MRSEASDERPDLPTIELSWEAFAAECERVRRAAPRALPAPASPGPADSTPTQVFASAADSTPTQAFAAAGTAGAASRAPWQLRPGLSRRAAIAGGVVLAVGLVACIGRGQLSPSSEAARADEVGQPVAARPADEAVVEVVPQASAAEAAPTVALPLDLPSLDGSAPAPIAEPVVAAIDTVAQLVDRPNQPALDGAPIARGDDAAATAASLIDAVRPLEAAATGGEPDEAATVAGGPSEPTAPLAEAGSAAELEGGPETGAVEPPAAKPAEVARPVPLPAAPLAAAARQRASSDGEPKETKIGGDGEKETKETKQAKIVGDIVGTVGKGVPPSRPISIPGLRPR